MLKDKFKIGVVGYFHGNFDKEKGKKYVKEAFEKLNDEYSYEEIVLVSGLTDYGIPAIAYRESENYEWQTIGISAKEAKEMDWYDCDLVILKGDKFGDESDLFLNNIDLLLKIGGGNQSEEEYEKANRKNIPTMKYDL